HAARRRGLIFQDAEDARQEIYLWILPAIPGYEPVRANKPCPVRTYLRSVIASRSCNFLNRARRHRQKNELFADLSAMADSQPQRAGTNPALSAEKQQERDQVSEALAKMSSPNGRICRLVAAGMSLAGLARRLGMTYWGAPLREA